VGVFSEHGVIWQLFYLQ